VFAAAAAAAACRKQKETWAQSKPCLARGPKVAWLQPILAIAAKLDCGGWGWGRARERERGKAHRPVPERVEGGDVVRISPNPSRGC